MSDVTLNGNEALRGDLKAPYQGAWTAEVELNADTVQVSAAQLVLMGRTFSGTVVASPSDPTLALSGDSGGWYRCRIVGGAGGLQAGDLAKPIAPRSFDQGATVQQVLAEIMTAAGETQAADIAPNLLNRFLTQWSYTAGCCAGAIGALVDYLGGGIVWRVRADGLFWMGVPAPAASENPPDYISVDITPETGQAVWDLNAASVDPDQIIDGLTVRQVVYSWTAGTLRALVTFAPGPVNALYQLFGAWLRRAGLDYFRATPGRINSQSGGTVELQPDDSRFAPLRRVGVRLGLPDTEVALVAGARAVATWEGAAAVAPVLQSFGASQATKIKVGKSAPLGTKPLVNKSQRDAESTMDTAITTALDAIPTAAAPTEPLAVAIRTALVAVSTAIKEYDGKAADFLTTILEGG